MATRRTKATAYVGTAGWALPRAHRDAFVPEGSLLERYALRLNAAEINSSFYRPHRPATYERWAASVPASFRFAVKLPRTITHERKLTAPGKPLDEFLAQAGALGDRLGCLLVQLPPSLVFDAAVARRFLRALRKRHAGNVAIEPRNASWFEAEADAMLVEHRVACVAADPARVPQAARPAGWPGLAYYRLHGSPRMYYSTYEDDRLDAWADEIRAHAGEARDTWCIFDNTAHGAATANALGMDDRLRSAPASRTRRHAKPSTA